MIHVTKASTLLRGEPAAIHCAVLGLARRLWNVAESDVVLRSPSMVMHRVVVDGEITCWLTWELAALSARVTRVELTHAEVGLPKPPEPELDDILVLLLGDLDSAHLSDV